MNAIRKFIWNKAIKRIMPSIIIGIIGLELLLRAGGGIHLYLKDQQ